MSIALHILDNLKKFGFEYFGRFYGSYQGTVANIEDPEFMGRIKVIVPEVTGDNAIGQWALPIGSFNGKDFGSQVIPPVGTLVWVSFKYGNPRAPLYTLGYTSKGSKTKEFRVRNNYWFKSPAGHSVQINDEDGTIIITHKEQGIIQVDKDSISLKNKKVYLGDLGKASHAVAKGDKTEEIIKDVTDYLRDMDTDINILANALNALAGGALSPVVTSTQERLSSTLTSINAKIETISSTVTKTE